ncbi:hypothetical protein LTR10_017027 [Elasticomyces elasticus]|uniref:Transmembrane protein n=1 Tax=Exophiala sideris TaxID=1016849 RepID=A0ABR0IZ59_9EURO|nr:hypothetical protein LTR10_017027 [Elasticomyces elasticus]KAK5023036.1 hypothetical protein LTS07_009529 [Exophiala sideris]KAK5026761.1 hypothetical protein LTR13_009801 [Exophiala sideris]KAK5052414.1 hypothetical protein LTR69_009752 [Exophiala sideris]KAK5178199.1 hypothetical protein LTR44_009283 [Eurotiomycetes sp. CCFEE 6388]
MASNRTAHLTILLCMLSLLHQALASPVARISAPKTDALSFAELIVRTFQRILDLGFLQGVLSTLLIVGCLVGLLICGLCALVNYMRHVDTGEMYENVGISESGELYFSKHEKRGRDDSSVTKISIHTSSSPRHVLPPSNAPSRSSRTASPSRSLSPPLRSALSKSPSPARRRQLTFFGSRTSSPTGSSKSVRWADEIQVSVIATFVDSHTSEKVAEVEMDIGVSRYEKAADLEDSTDVPPAYNVAASDDAIGAPETEKALTL